MPNNLTPKQEKFVQELVKGKSQREAYKKAYNASKMADSVIDVKASELFKNGKVAVRFNELRGKVVKRAEEKAIITAEEVIREIASIAKDDISNYLEFYTDYDGDIKVNVKDSREIDTKNISEVTLGKDGQFKFKTYCRDTALYKLAEIMGLNEATKAKQKLAEDRFKHDREIDSKKYW